MKNNKIVIYIGLLAAGILLGWVIFGGSSKKETDHNHEVVAETNQMWTCSMHPQIMQPEPGDCPICGMDLIPAETGSDGLLANQFKLTDNAMALANIQTSIIGKGNVEGHVLTLSGKIAENEKANAVQVSYVSGRIEQLYVNATGETVSKGQLLASIYSPELYAAQQELITAASIKNSQPELYQAVRNKLKLWKLSESQINHIETTGKVQENVSVYATVSGTVTEKLVAQGDYVKQGEPFLKIANLNSVWANFDVYENQIDLLKKGQQVIVTAKAYPNKEFTGTVDFINPVLNTQTRTVTLRVVLDNKDLKFKPGMFVTASIEGGLKKNEDVLTIPASAVLWTGKRSVVYLKTQPNQPVFEMQEVVLGNKIGDTYEVVDGVFVGNEIVTHGTFTVDAAAQLQGKKSMMNKEGNKTMTGHQEHSGDHASNTDSKQVNIHERMEVSGDFQAQLSLVFNDYIALKDALVKEDSKRAVTASNNFLSHLSEIDMELLKGEAHKQWMALENDLRTSAVSISKASSIPSQRDFFKQLSAKLTKALEVFGINETAYLQFCPMADNNQGAYWLSKEKKVINPYFGEAMLTCGEVKQVID
ncbi:MAG: efflux transporter periplasmic adaptor subunit [Xanthomarina sp.]|uniref:efflux RND transporter periplasmic adaptor subunit n=1 Tax=Xanthomarina sp. TaxID=1931211 RepID=UPI000C3AEA82|nr:efflux RND transporter periplasmic adaptor subunit [Xanthomarina sp.]MAL23025.1 efflux transporter periplasmic adaptor subunit [Xanthomarina sp.]MBF62949.1 efflux transporter periplasmic adaptor subunit [Xanthomarina sp.]